MRLYFERDRSKWLLGRRAAIFPSYGDLEEDWVLTLHHFWFVVVEFGHWEKYGERLT